MPKMIQIRNVPEELHRVLKARAATEGMSLSDYLLVQIRSAAELPTPSEMLARLEQLEPLQPAEPAAEVLRPEREAR